MVRPESAPQAVSLLPFLQPSSHAPRLVLTQWTTDASCPFALVDDSAPFSRIIRGTFQTASGCHLKDVFLILQRDKYRLKATPFNPITNPDIDACWQNILARSRYDAGDAALITLTANAGGNNGVEVFAPILFCREKQVFMPILCAKCGKDLELCHDDELLLQKGLFPYGSSLRRYLFCAACSKSGISEFFVLEREDTDPLFLMDCRDLIDRLRLIIDSENAPDKLLCTSCPEQRKCFGPENSVRSRLLPFSFYPFHLLIVAAPALHMLDFSALLSGASCKELADQIDSRIFPGRIESLAAFEENGPVIWTNFAKGDERAFTELLFLKLSLLEEVLGQAAVSAVMPPQGENVWIYLPRICRNLPLGWNFKLLFTDKLTPLPPVLEVERNPLMVLARTGLLYFQVLLGSQDLVGTRIVDAVREYVVVDGDDTVLRSLCVPASIFRYCDKVVLNQQQENFWERACAVGFALLDAARGRNSMSPQEINLLLRKLMEESRGALFSAERLPASPVVPVQAASRDNAQAQLTISRVVAEMIANCRAGRLTPSPAPPENYSDEIVETIILRAGTITEPTVAQDTSMEGSATLIIPSGPPVEEKIQEVFTALEEELNETMILSSPRPEQHEVAPKLPQAPATSSQQTAPEQEQDDLAETVMITPLAGRYRPGGTK